MNPAMSAAAPDAVADQRMEFEIDMDAPAWPPNRISRLEVILGNIRASHALQVERIRIS